MNQAFLCFDIKSTDYTCPFAVSVWHNNQCVYQTDHVTEPVTVTHQFDDETEADHELKITVSGKLSQHTEIDSGGNIVKDALLVIDNFLLDDINVDQILINTVEYHHDCNGTAKRSTHKFYHTVGCNGDIIFNFSSPLYLWMLARM
jgi:hypothetical protein